MHYDATKSSSVFGFTWKLNEFNVPRKVSNSIGQMWVAFGWCRLAQQKAIHFSIAICPIINKQTVNVKWCVDLTSVKNSFGSSLIDYFSL